MNDNNDKWLEKIISKTINTNKPQFDSEKWKQKFPDEFRILLSRKTTQPASSALWTRIFKSPITKFAAAAIIILCAALFINRLFWESSNEQPPVISTGTQIGPSPNTDIVTIGAQKGSSVTAAVTAAIPVLPEPGPDVCLDRNLAGEKMIRKMTEDGAIQIGRDLYWFCSEVKGGEFLNFRQEDALIYVSINGGQEHLIGVRLRTVNDLKDLQYALLVSETPFALWSDIQPPVEITNLPNLEKIKSFQQVYPKELNDMRPLSSLANLEWIYIYKQQEPCLGINDISALANLKELRFLTLRVFMNLSGISKLGANLTYLDLTDAGNLKNISNLRNNKKLENLKLNSCSYITDISSLENLTSLKSLDLFGCKSSDLSPLSNLTNLTYLNLRACKLTDLRPLADLIKLNCLNIGLNENLSNISPIAELSNLKELELWGCHKLSNIQPISNLHNLEILNLRGCDNISDISSLSELQNLIKLDCAYCKRLSDISDLANLKNLTRVDLTMCLGITDISAIKPLIGRDADIFVSDTLMEQLSAIRGQILQERIDKSSAIVQVELLEATDTEISGKLVRSDWKVEVNSYYYGNVPEKIINTIWDDPYPEIAKLAIGRYVVLFLKVDESGIYNIIHAQTRLFSNLQDESIKREYEIIRAVRDEIARQTTDSNNLQ